CFFCQAEDGIRDWSVTGVQTCALPIFFNHLQLVTCRTFETLAANTIPLFGFDESYVAEFYGEEARELVMPAVNPQARILDILERPQRYAEIVAVIRQRLTKEHSYQTRIRELIEMIEE